MSHYIAKRADSPAFPVFEGDDGICLRDYIACQALIGIVTNGYENNGYDYWANAAYNLADAMLKRRTKTD